MCGECPQTKNVHNGLCPDCAAALRAELEQYKQAMAAGVWVDGRRFGVIKAMLADYDTPAELPWDERAIAKLLSHTHNPAAWR